jgi:hypothetical protein
VLRPLVVDVLAAIAPVAVGGLAFFGAMRLRHRPIWLFRTGVALVLGIVAVLGLAYFTSLKDRTGPLLFPVGGEMAVACWSAAFLVGVVWVAPGRSVSSGFLALVVALAGVLLFLNGAAPVGWRLLGGKEWNNVPAADGTIAQTTGWTCAPCAAAMLLHKRGIRSTEGEMAYLSGTSWMGTDLYATAYALNRKAEGQPLKASALRTDYEACRRLGEPFLATVQLPGVGGHAVLVERVDENRVELVDPLRGRQLWSRAEFASRWDGGAVFLFGGK